MAYLAKLSPDTAATAAHRRAPLWRETSRRLPPTRRTRRCDQVGRATGAVAAGARLGARYADGITEGNTSNTGSIQTAWDAVGSALAKGPEARVPQEIRAVQGRFRQSAKTIRGNVARIIDDSSKRTNADLGRLADSVETGAVGAQQWMRRSAGRAGRAFPAALQMAVGPTATAAENFADAAKAPPSTVPPKAATYGDHALLCKYGTPTRRRRRYVPPPEQQ
jgi:hypothetical protein